MIDLYSRLAGPILRALDAEQAHGLAVKALRFAPLPPSSPDSRRLAVRAFGLEFPNPIGMAAGFDKNAETVDGILQLGFGFAEIGTVTPRPQAGNPRPRLFRLEADEGIINRLGFNNDGHAAALARLEARRSGGIVGVNIGANRDSTDRIADYVSGIATFASVASYFTVNVSSPNTPGLRDLQQATVLDELLARVLDAREAAAQRGLRRPVLLKIAPDLALGDLDDVIAVARRRRIDGLIVSNTTISRPDTLRDGATAQQLGGLSGRPLFPLSTQVLAQAFVRAEGAFPLIGVGGIDSGEAALAKIRAGASLIQLYTGLVFRGPSLIRTIKDHLIGATKDIPLTDLVGRDAPQWNAAPAPNRSA